MKLAAMSWCTVPPKWLYLPWFEIVWGPFRVVLSRSLSL